MTPSSPSLAGALPGVIYGLLFLGFTWLIVKVIRDSWGGPRP
jgi:hypothetical protein